MADSLYVCLFSNGSIKVGRSKNAPARVRQHQDRVAVLGVSVVDWVEFPCDYSVVAAEAWLIRACTLAAEVTRSNEWFEGITFQCACDLAHEACIKPRPHSADLTDGPRPDFKAIIRALNAAGYRQTDLARHCGISQPSVSAIASGSTGEPTYSIGYTLVRLLKEADRFVADEEDAPFLALPVNANEAA